VSPAHQDRKAARRQYPVPLHGVRLPAAAVQRSAEAVVHPFPKAAARLPVVLRFPEAAVHRFQEGVAAVLPVVLPSPEAAADQELVPEVHQDPLPHAVHQVQVAAEAAAVQVNRAGDEKIIPAGKGEREQRRIK